MPGPAVPCSCLTSIAPLKFTPKADKLRSRTSTRKGAVASFPGRLTCQDVSMSAVPPGLEAVPALSLPEASRPPWASILKAPDNRAVSCSRRPAPVSNSVLLRFREICAVRILPSASRLTASGPETPTPSGARFSVVRFRRVLRVSALSGEAPASQSLMFAVILPWPAMAPACSRSMSRLSSPWVLPRKVVSTARGSARAASSCLSTPLSSATRSCQGACAALFKLSRALSVSVSRCQSPPPFISRPMP